jgi:non-ribosomal peptide synthetase component F
LEPIEIKHKSQSLEITNTDFRCGEPAYLIEVVIKKWIQVSCEICRGIVGYIYKPALLFFFPSSLSIISLTMAAPRSVQRLQQTLSHVQPPSSPQLSIVAGPTEPQLLDITLGELLTLQALQYGGIECLVFPWTGARWTYGQLKDETDRLALGMLASGILKGDRVGIMAGNCEQYISVFFAAARVGAILVVLNNTYTPSELYYALNHSGELISTFCITVSILISGFSLSPFRMPNAFHDPAHWTP